MPKPVYVYALCDPDTAEVRYIGVSNHPRRRLSGHLKGWERFDSSSTKNQWLDELAGQGKIPSLLILEQITGKTWQEAERYWISEYLTRGHRLTNTHPGGTGHAGGEDGVPLTPDEMPMREAIRYGRVGARFLIRAIKRGRIQGRFGGYWWIVSKPSLDQYLQERMDEE